MAKNGSDKPDLRNPLIICDLTDFFADVKFPAFKGRPVRGIVADCRDKSNKFFEDSLKKDCPYIAREPRDHESLFFVKNRNGVIVAF